MVRPFDTPGKTAVIATMHSKERVIIPALAPLGLEFLPSPPIDTDRFGTFTRDIRRAFFRLRREAFSLVWDAVCIQIVVRGKFHELP